MKQRISDRSGNALMLKQFFIAAFVVYFKDEEKKYCFFMSQRNMIIKKFGLQHFPDLPC